MSIAIVFLVIFVFAIAALLYGLRGQAKSHLDSSASNPPCLPFDSGDQPAEDLGKSHSGSIPHEYEPSRPPATTTVTIATALQQVCRRRAELLERGQPGKRLVTRNDERAAFDQIDRELTEDIISEHPPAPETIESLELAIKGFAPLVDDWIANDSTDTGARQIAIRNLGDFLSRYGVDFNSAHPLCEYYFIVRAGEALATRSISEVYSAADQYLSVRGVKEDSKLPNRYFLFSAGVKHYAQHVREQLKDYERLPSSSIKLNRIDTLRTCVMELQKVDRDDVALSGFEAQLDLYIFSESRNFLESERHIVRGRPSWEVSITEPHQLEIGGAQPPCLHLELVDHNCMRPRSVRVSIPDCAASPEQAYYHTISATLKQFEPQKNPKMALDVGIEIPQPSVTGFKLQVQFPVTVVWEDGGVRDSQQLVVKETLSCSVVKPRLNPYTDGRAGHSLAGDSPLFTGRVELVKEIQTHLEEKAGTFFVLWGLSRSGKTSVLNRISYLLKDKMLAVSTSGHIEGGHPGGYVAALKERVLSALNSYGIHLSERKAQRVQNPSKGGPLQDFFYFLSDIETTLQKHQKTLLIILDEYDKLKLDSNLGSNDTTLWLLKTVFDRTEYARLVRFLAAGTFSLSQLDPASAAWREVLGGRMTHKNLGLFRKEEASELIVNHSLKARVSWSTEMVECAYALAGGHPYLTNLLCFYVVEEAYKRNASLVVDKKLIEFALEEWIRESGGGLDDLKFCYDEPTSWTSFETKLILHTLSKLCETKGASYLEELPSWTPSELSGYLNRHYPSLPTFNLEVRPALKELHRRQVIVSRNRKDAKDAYAIRFGILDFALRRSGAQFEHLLREKGYHE